MDSDRSEGEEQRENFAKKGGEALNLDNDNFNDSEDVDEEEDDPQEMMKAQQNNKLGSGDKPGGQKEVKGEKLDN